MAKKIDKDFLIKNAFWIGLGGYVLLWFVAAALVLWPGEIEGKKTYDTAKAEMEKSKNARPKTAKYQDPWNEHADKFRAQKDKVWAQAWRQQVEMYDWPSEMTFRPQYPADLWIDNPNSPPSEWNRLDLNNREKFREWYRDQFVSLEREMTPVELAGGVEGIMQPQGYNSEWAKTGGWNPNKAPTRAEIWLAQEDFWVRRELLWIVRQAVNTVAFFRDVTAEVTAQGGSAEEKAKDKDDDKTADKDAKAKDKDKDQPDKKGQPDKDKGKDDKKDQPAKDKDGKDEKKEPAKDKDGKDEKKTDEPQKAKEEKKKPKGEEPSEKNGYRRVFRNANWEMDFRFKKDGSRWVIDTDKSTIKNVNATERTLPLANPNNNNGLAFKLWQGRSGPVILVPGEPVPYGQAAPIKPKNPTVEPLNPREPFGVEQLLEWQMSPVRRIEAFEVPYQSHRTSTVPLKGRDDLKEMDKDAEPPPAEGSKDDKDKSGGGGGGQQIGQPTPGGMIGGKGGMVTPGGPERGDSKGGDAQAADVTPVNKINRLRYLAVTTTSSTDKGTTTNLTIARHLPIAMKLIVDQSHVHDVLTAVANSRLRIQITQVSLHHVRNVPRGSERKDEKGKGGEWQMPKGGSGDERPPGYVSMPRYGGSSQGPIAPTVPGPEYMGMKGKGSGGGNGTKDRGKTGPDEPSESKSVVQDTAQLVELTVYGIATLYERYPPRKPAAEAEKGK